ncbi:flavodoxin family protein [bacterium]|nr:MAG: flavodoxin family protein [bacterium]
MVKVLIAFSSSSGNTEKLAKAVALGVTDAGGEPLLKRAGEVTTDDLVAADAIILGSPVYFGTLSAEVKGLIDRSVTVRRKLKDKVGAAFVTSGHDTGGKETTIISIHLAFLIHEMVVVGDPIEAGGHFGAACRGTPTEKDEKCGALLGERVVKIAGKLKAE